MLNALPVSDKAVCPVLSHFFWLNKSQQGHPRSYGWQHTFVSAAHLIHFHPLSFNLQDVPANQEVLCHFSVSRYFPTLPTLPRNFLSWYLYWSKRMLSTLDPGDGRRYKGYGVYLPWVRESRHSLLWIWNPREPPNCWGRVICFTKDCISQSESALAR